MHTVYTVMASSAAESNPEQARRLGRASLEFSIAGIVVTLVIVIIVFAVVASRRHDEGICGGWGCVFWDD